VEPFVLNVDNLERDDLLHSPAVVLSVQWAGQTVGKVIQPFLVRNGALAPSTHLQKCYPDGDESLTTRMFNRALCDTSKVVELALSRLKMK
jgi:hypothetical protein